MDSDLVSYFLSLSDETLVTVVFPQLPLDVIKQLCSIHIRFHNVCQNENLWLIKINNDYPVLPHLKPATSTWKDFYIYLFNNFKNIPIIYHNQLIGDILIYKFDTWDIVINKIRSLIKLPKMISFLDNNNNILSYKVELPQVWPIIDFILLSDIDVNRIQPMRSSKVIPQIYTISELQNIAKSLGLSTSGNKQVLVDRILNA